jgi:hypothetical protein
MFDVGAELRNIGGALIIFKTTGRKRLPCFKDFSKDRRPENPEISFTSIEIGLRPTPVKAKRDTVQNVVLKQEANLF